VFTFEIESKATGFIKKNLNASKAGFLNLKCEHNSSNIMASVKSHLKVHNGKDKKQIKKNEGKIFVNLPET